MNEKTIYVTAAGLNELQAELEELRNVKRPQIMERLEDEKGESDWMDNAGSVLVQEELARIDGRIAEVEHMLANAQLIKPGRAGDDTVSVGSTVVIRYQEGDEETYRIVGAAEADPAKGLISNESPLGKGLLGHKVGEDVTVNIPAGELQLHIVSVE